MTERETGRRPEPATAGPGPDEPGAAGDGQRRGAVNPDTAAEPGDRNTDASPTEEPPD